MSEQRSELPITIDERIRTNGHIMEGLAQRAFRLAGYDMTPDNAVERAIDRGLIVVEARVSQNVAPPMPIRRMPGNGSFA